MMKTEMRTKVMIDNGYRLCERICWISNHELIARIYHMRSLDLVGDMYSCKFQALKAKA